MSTNILTIARNNPFEPHFPHSIIPNSSDENSTKADETLTINGIPQDPQIEILKYSDFRGLANMSLTNKYFNWLVVTDRIWEYIGNQIGCSTLFNRDFPFYKQVETIA